MIGPSEIDNEASRAETERTGNNSGSHPASRAETTISNSHITARGDMNMNSYNFTQTVHIHNHEESVVLIPCINYA